MINKLKSSEIKLPSNKKFGYFFSAIFLITAIYFLYTSSKTVGYVMVVIALFFFITTLIKAKLLLPLNKLWMQFGLLLGMIISPIVLGIIFFGLLTPYGVIMRIMGRDELRLKIIKTNSNWKLRSIKLPQTNFKQQF